MLQFQILADVTLVPAVTDLINHAYRGSDGARRWTTEQHLVAGPRIDQTAVQALLQEPDSMLLVGVDAGELVCCLSIKHMGEVVEFGTFAVLPSRQGQGIGKQFLTHAEQTLQGTCRCFQVTVVNRCTALLDFYRKRGYVESSVILPYPATAQNRPKVEGLALVVLRKSAAS